MSSYGTSEHPITREHMDAELSISAPSPEDARDTEIEDALRTALADGRTVLDECDTEYVVEAALPVLRRYAEQRHEDGIERGYRQAKQAVARTLGLGDLLA